MTVAGFLGFAAELRGFTGDAKRKAVYRVVEMCFLDPVLNQSIETLSKGYKHRTCFAQSILHDPEVLILDEPTDGLDPNQKHEVRTLIRAMGEKKAIIFSTYILEEVEAVCSHAIIIDRGRVVANGTPAELKRRSEHAGTVTLRLGKGSPAAEIAAGLNAIPGIRSALVKSEEPVILKVTPCSETVGSIAGAIYDFAAKNAWKPEELHIDEGRSTRFSGASRWATRVERRLRNEVVARNLYHRQTRGGRLFLFARDVCFHRDFPAAGGLFHVHGFELVSHGAGKPERLPDVASVALSFSSRQSGCGCGARSGGWEPSSFC